MNVITLNDKQNKAVIITNETPVVGPNQTIVGNKVYANVGSSNATLYTGVAIPDHVKQGLYAFDGTDWTIHAGSVPRSVSMRQARLAMFEAGILDTVETSVAGMSKDVQINWEFSDTFERDNALVTGIAEQLGMIDEQVDELFIKASVL